MVGEYVLIVKFGGEGDEKVWEFRIWSEDLGFKDWGFEEVWDFEEVWEFEGKRFGI